MVAQRLFENFRTYQNHRLTHRPRVLDELPATETDEDLGENDSGMETTLALPYIPSNSEMQSYAAKWILKTSEMRRLTRTATLGVVEDASDLVVCGSVTKRSSTP